MSSHTDLKNAYRLADAARADLVDAAVTATLAEGAYRTAIAALAVARGPDVGFDEAAALASAYADAAFNAAAQSATYRDAYIAAYGHAPYAALDVLSTLSALATRDAAAARA